MDDVYIKLELTTVYGKLAGDPADPLVLGLHGWSQRNGWHTWEPLMAPLAEAGYCVVSVDMPGWGESAAIDSLPLAGWRAVSVVMDILNGLQKETAVLMGKSWGGGVAVQTAVAYPNASRPHPHRARPARSRPACSDLRSRSPHLGRGRSRLSPSPWLRSM